MSTTTMAVLLHGDCLERMKELPDKSVDLFLCDLPYGCLSMGKGDNVRAWAGPNSKHAIKQSGCAWDIPIDLSQFWTQVKRLCRDDHTPVLMFCSTKFGFELYNSNPDWFRYDLVWNKKRGVSFLMANKAPMRSHEMIYVFAKKGAKYYRKDVEGEYEPYAFKGTPPAAQYSQQTNRTPTQNDGTTRCVKSVIEAPNHTLRKSSHPTQKPDNLYEWLIERYSKEGDTVLDPTAGSFASVFTADRLGRKAIGIEKDDGFFNSALSRSNTDRSTHQQ